MPFARSVRNSLYIGALLSLSVDVSALVRLFSPKTHFVAVQQCKSNNNNSKKIKQNHNNNTHNEKEATEKLKTMNCNMGKSFARLPAPLRDVKSYIPLAVWLI